MSRKNIFGKSLAIFVAAFLMSGCSVPGFSVPVTGLRPISPEVRFDISPVPRFRAYTEKVDSLQPTFRWEAYPRPKDLKGEKAGWKDRIQNVTYELKIWKLPDSPDSRAVLDVLVGPLMGLMPDGLTLPLVYHRAWLPDPSHRIDQSLKPSTEYLWTIRARYELDGKSQVIRWAIMGQGYGVLPHPTKTFPNRRLFRFKAPPKEEKK